MITNKSDTNHQIITKALWLGFELAIVADSELWNGHSIALVAGNRHKAELRKTAIFHSMKNPQLQKQLGIQS